MKKIEAYESAYPGSMFEREDGGFVRRDDAESLAGSLLALIKSGDHAAEDLRDALTKAENDRWKFRQALLDLLTGDVGQQTLAKLMGGQGTDTDDGRAWMRAAEMVTPN